MIATCNFKTISKGKTYGMTRERERGWPKCKQETTEKQNDAWKMKGSDEKKNCPNSVDNRSHYATGRFVTTDNRFSRSSIIILFARTCRGSGKWLEIAFRSNRNGNQCIERKTTKGSFLPVIRTVYCYATEGRRMARAELVTSEGQRVPADFS